jgi:polysaccharide export outer membrane protein
MALKMRNGGTVSTTGRFLKAFLLRACGLLVCGSSLALAQPQRTSRELFDYIEEARKLGLGEQDIRKNALTAGWDQTTIDQTYSIVRQLNNEKRPSGPGLQSGSPIAETYRIGAGDVLQIVVWKDPEASVPAAVVRVDGKISMPLIGEVDVAGLAPAELEKSLIEKFSKFINHPVITVITAAVNSRKVYVAGAVRKEGPVLLVRPMTVLQAINEAGGLAEYAKKKKIYVLRMENGRQVRLPFDYDAVTKGERLQQNISLLPDDTIIVPGG